MTTLPAHRLSLVLALALLMIGTPVGELLALSGDRGLPGAVRVSPAVASPQAEGADPIAALPLNGMASRRLMPTVGTTSSDEVHAAATSYDPTPAVSGRFVHVNR